MNPGSLRAGCLHPSEDGEIAFVLASRLKYLMTAPLDTSGRSHRDIGPGLRNIGNTCFANAVIQCLTHIPPFATFLQEKGHSILCSVSRSVFCAFCAMERHVVAALSSPQLCLTPNDIVLRLKDIASDFRLGQQEDAHEFLCHLLDKMHTSSSAPIGSKPSLSQASRGPCPVDALFGFTLESSVKCLKCGSVSRTLERGFSLSVEVHGSRSVEEALRHFTAPEQLNAYDAYRCDTCHQLSPAEKTLKIKAPPNVLVLHLKRFSFSSPGGLTANPFAHLTGARKIRDPIRFEETLCLSPFLSAPSDSEPAPSVDPCYSLVGAVLHEGFSPAYGHYTALVKSHFGRWYLMDDHQIAPATLDSVLSNPSAYLLFYVRQLNPSSTPPPSFPSSDSIPSPMSSPPSFVLTPALDGYLLTLSLPMLDGSARLRLWVDSYPQASQLVLHVSPCYHLAIDLPADSDSDSAEATFIRSRLQFVLRLKRHPVPDPSPERSLLPSPTGVSSPECSPTLSPSVNPSSEASSSSPAGSGTSPERSVAQSLPAIPLPLVSHPPPPTSLPPVEPTDARASSSELSAERSSSSGNSIVPSAEPSCEPSTSVATENSPETSTETARAEPPGEASADRSCGVNIPAMSSTGRIIAPALSHPPSPARAHTCMSDRPAVAHPPSQLASYPNRHISPSTTSTTTTTTTPTTVHQLHPTTTIPTTVHQLHPTTTTPTTVHQLHPTTTHDLRFSNNTFSPEASLEPSPEPSPATSQLSTSPLYTPTSRSIALPAAAPPERPLLSLPFTNVLAHELE